MTLDRPGASGEPSSESLHARPAQAGLVVGVICEGTVGGDHLRGHPREYEIAYLGDASKSGLHRHNQPPRVVRRCALAILDVKIHQSGGHWSKLWFRRFFYVLFRGLLYLAMYLHATVAARVPELEAASGQREAPETSSEEADKGIILQDQDEPQRRSWLHRLLIHT